jgi:tripeptide aminopeptidase
LGSDAITMFCSLASIPSPSGFERDVGNHIKDLLKKEGVSSHFDNSGEKNNSNAGNLIATLKGTGSRILFIAHMDTVETGKEPIKPIIKANYITTDGSSILGADNKVSVACLINAIRQIKRIKNHPTITFVFSTREETGSMGVKYLDIPKDTRFVFVLDGAYDAGTFINKALGQIPFTIELYGKEVHAGYDPRKGVNAIQAAVQIISRLDIGKAKDGSTLNIGKINGGTVVNVVPGKTVVSGEVRSFTYKKMQKKLDQIENVVIAVCKSTGCKYKFVKKVKEGAPPLLVHRDNDILALAKAAAQDAGLTFSLRSIRGTTETNILNSRGIPILGVSRGGDAPHARNEAVELVEFERLTNLIVSIVKNAVQYS